MNFNYSKIFCFEKIKRVINRNYLFNIIILPKLLMKISIYYKKLKEHLNYFENGCITFFVYFIHKEKSIKNNLLGMSTRVFILASYLFFCKENLNIFNLNKCNRN